MNNLNTIQKENYIIKKNLFGEPSIIYPWKVNGKVNWKNLLIGGSWSSFIGWVLFAVLIIFCANAYFNDMNQMISLVECYRNQFDAMMYYNCEDITTNWERSIGVYDYGYNQDYLFEVNSTNNKDYIYPGFNSPLNEILNKIFKTKNE